MGSTLMNLLMRLRYRMWSMPKRLRDLDRALLLLGYFKQLGWFDSLGLKGPIDRQGQPLPWYTYPAIFWLDSLLTGDERVFEYGAGHSTLWYAQRVAQVVSVEHNQRWYEQVSLRVPSNVRLSLVATGVGGSSTDEKDEYVASIFQDEGSYDIIVVDGQARNACCCVAVRCLLPGGLLILDNADRNSYEPAHQFLAEQGFFRVDFSGPIPGNIGWGCTSIFAKDLTRWPTTHRRPPRWQTRISAAWLQAGENPSLGGQSMRLVRTHRSVARV